MKSKGGWPFFFGLKFIRLISALRGNLTSITLLSFSCWIACLNNVKHINIKAIIWENMFQKYNLLDTQIQDCNPETSHRYQILAIFKAGVTFCQPSVLGPSSRWGVYFLRRHSPSKPPRCVSNFRRDLLHRRRTPTCRRNCRASRWPGIGAVGDLTWMVTNIDSSHPAGRFLDDLQWEDKW